MSVCVLGSVCEVLQVPGLQVEGEEQVQRLDPAAVDGDVQQAADDVHVLGGAAVQAGGGQLQASQQLLHLGGPLLHQAVDGGRGPAVLDAGGGLGAVEGADAVHPAVQLPGVGLGTGNAGHRLQLHTHTHTTVNLCVCVCTLLQVCVYLVAAGVCVPCC